MNIYNNLIIEMPIVGPNLYEEEFKASHENTICLRRNEYTKVLHIFREEKSHVIWIFLLSRIAEGRHILTYEEMRKDFQISEIQYLFAINELIKRHFLIEVNSDTFKFIPYPDFIIK